MIFFFPPVDAVPKFGVGCVLPPCVLTTHFDGTFFERLRNASPLKVLSSQKSEVGGQMVPFPAPLEKKETDSK